MKNQLLNYFDAVSGVEVTQLTGLKANSYLFYFTNPGWYSVEKKLLFGSTIGGQTNLCGVEISTGKIEQITELKSNQANRGVNFQNACKNPVKEEVYYWYDRLLMNLHLKSGRIDPIFEIDPQWRVSKISSSADGRYVYFGIWEKSFNDNQDEMQEGQLGFEKTWAEKPLSLIMEVSIDGRRTNVIYEEKTWINQVNASPTQVKILTFCHEGPWEKIDQRIWGLDISSGKAWKIRLANGNGHIRNEYWFADGLQIGYHGRTVGGIPMIGHIKYDNQMKYEQHFEQETGQIFSVDEKVIIGDGKGVIQIWKWNGNSYDGPRILCEHRSSLRSQYSHPHPRISPDASYVIFTSDYSGFGQLYRVPLVDFYTLPVLI